MRPCVPSRAGRWNGETVGKTADLTLAKKRKKDEFYTQLVDIENELKHYREHFKDKVVLCNCDDPRKSNFFKYFADNFEKLQLKRLIATCYKSQDVDLFSQGDCERAICQIYEGDKNGNMVVDDDEVCVKELKGDGDFRSAECIEILMVSWVCQLHSWTNIVLSNLKLSACSIMVVILNLIWPSRY